jgi:hypothetical protein
MGARPSHKVLPLWQRAASHAELKIGWDFVQAGMVLHHGEKPEDYLLAHELHEDSRPMLRPPHRSAAEKEVGAFD